MRPQQEKLYAEALGITLRQLDRLGGMEKLMRMDIDARQTLINMSKRESKAKRNVF